MRAVVLLLFLTPALPAAEVTGINVIHHHGQTFVTWKDVAEGEAGAQYRYTLYRSPHLITQTNLAKADVCFQGVLNHSGKLFGSAFNQKDRLDPAKPMATIEESSQPLPLWSGLAVHTATKDEKAYYAVAATDEKFVPQSKIVAGQSATTEAVDEKVAPIQPIKLYDSKMRGQYSPQTSITGQKGLPMQVELHASQGQGGGAGDYGDYYLYFATPKMGWRDGLPGIFTVEERRDKSGNTLLLQSRDAIEHPNGKNAMETYWFGYLGVPFAAAHPEPRAYPFTEERMLWLIDWAAKKYAADLERMFAGGGSMGAWGSTTFAFRHPELFAAVYPNRPRTRQRGLPSLVDQVGKDKKVLMADGKTDYFERMDMVKFATDHPADLPFYAWCCGRRDGFASWQEQIDMVKSLAAAHHGFAFAWNDGDHSSGAQPMEKVLKYYPPEKFARNQSYPAFANSSIDQKLGNGDPKDGDLEGGFNLGFLWRDVIDENGKWSVKLANDLATAEMTMDVTPRRCQKFKVKPGESLQWTTSDGRSGKVTADKNGLATVTSVKLLPGQETTLTITAKEKVTATKFGAWDHRISARPFRYHTPPANTHPLMAKQADYDLPSLLVTKDGTPIRSAKEWETRREELVQEWTHVLGKLKPNEADQQWFGDAAKVEIQEVTEKAGYTRIALTIPIEKDFQQPHLLLIPKGQGDGPFPAVIAWTSTSPDYTQPEVWWGAWLAQRGFVVLTGWSHIRHYREGRDFRKQVNEAVYDRFGRWLPLGKMVHDVQREVEFLKSRQEVDATRIGFIGFSLSAKASLYVAAFAPEISATVSIDPHIAINGATNYGDPWYLDWKRKFKDINTPDYPDESLQNTVWSLLDIDPKRPGFERNHHELMALCAPRALMVIGCSTDQDSAVHSDDKQSLGYVNRAKEVYELLRIPDRFAYAALTGGHRATGEDLDPHWQAFFQKWLKETPIRSNARESQTTRISDEKR